MRHHHAATCRALFPGTRFPGALLLGALLLTTAPAANSQELPVFPLPATITGFLPNSVVLDARFSGDGTLLWTTSQVQLKAWDVASGQLVHDEGTTHLQWRGDDTGAVNWQLNGSMGRNAVRYIPAVSNDGKWVSVINTDPNLKQTAMLWDAAARTMRHIGTYKTIAGFAPDNSRMVVVSHDGKVELRDPATGNPDRVLFSDPAATAYLYGDGTYLGITAGKKALIYSWPWDKPEKNKGNNKRRFDFLTGNYYEGQPVLAVNPDRSLRLRRVAWQQERAGVWRHTYQIERADGTVVSQYVSTDECKPCAIVGSSGLWAMMLETKVRLIRIDTGAVAREYPLVEDASAFNQRMAPVIREALLAQRAAKGAAAAAATTPTASAGNRPAEFQQFLVNFEQLPNSWVLDYNSLRAREITQYAWTSRSFGNFFAGQTFNAVGKVADCANGSVALLTLTRSQRGSADTSLFQLAVFAADGQLSGTHEIGQTQKDSSGQPLVVAFALTANAAQARIDIRQSRWDGDRNRSLTLDKNSCSVR